MRKTVTLSVVLGLIVLGAWAVRETLQPKEVAARGLAGPAIEYLSGRAFDAGVVASGEMVRHQFVFMNTGDTRIDIDHLAASCACTSATLDKHRLEPGESAMLEVSIDTSDRSGTLFAYVELFQSEESITSFQLRVAIENKRRIVVDPTRLVLSHGTSSDSAGLQLDLVVESLVEDPTPDLTISMEPEYPPLKVSEPVEVDAGVGWRRYRVMISKSSDCAARTVFATVKCTASIQGVAVSDQAVIEIEGQHAGIPATVFLGGALEPGDPKDVLIRLPPDSAEVLSANVPRSSAESIQAMWQGAPASGDGAGNGEGHLLIRVVPTGVGLIRERVELGPPTCPVVIEVVGSCLAQRE